MPIVVRRARVFAAILFVLLPPEFMFTAHGCPGNELGLLSTLGYNIDGVPSERTWDLIKVADVFFTSKEYCYSYKNDKKKRATKLQQ